MSFLVALAGQWRAIAAGLALVGAVWLGFYIKGKFERAAQADLLEKRNVELNERWRAQVRETAEADRDRLAVSEKLAAAETALKAKTKGVVTYVTRTVTRDPACAIAVDVLSKLNENRGGAVPASP